MCSRGTLPSQDMQLTRELQKYLEEGVSEVSSPEALKGKELQLSPELRGDIEKVFMSLNILSPNSELLEKICPPRNFPYDLFGRPVA